MKNLMKRPLVNFIKPMAIMLFIALSFSSCSKDEDIAPVDTGTGTSQPTVEVDAPEFTLKSLTGSDVSLSNFKNKVVVLFFFGNNCPTCKAVAPNIENSLLKPFANNPDYILLGLDQWNGNAASVEAFKSSTGVSFPLLLNASGVASNYKTTFDRILVLNKAHKIVFLGKQSATSDIASAKAKVTELLSK